MRGDATIDDSDYEQANIVQLLRPHSLHKLRVDEVVLPRAAAAAKHPVSEKHKLETALAAVARLLVAAATPEHAVHWFTKKLDV